MLEIIDFENHEGNWVRGEKIASVGKCFWNRGELCMIVDVVDLDANPVLMRVANRKGEVKTKAGWNAIQQGDVPMDRNNTNTKRTFLPEEEAAQYAPMIQKLNDFVQGRFQAQAAVDDYKQKYEELLSVLKDYNLEYKKYSLNGQEYKILMPRED